METIKEHLIAMSESPKTTFTGVAGIVGVVFMVVNNPAILSDPEKLASTITTLIVSIGLLVAADAKGKKPSEEPPK